MGLLPLLRVAVEFSTNAVVWPGGGVSAPNADRREPVVAGRLHVGWLSQQVHWRCALREGTGNAGVEVPTARDSVGNVEQCSGIEGMGIVQREHVSAAGHRPARARVGIISEAIKRRRAVAVPRIFSADQVLPIEAV